MSNENKLQSAVEFLLDQHLQGEPSSDEAKERFALAKSHKEALAEEAQVENVPAAPTTSLVAVLQPLALPKA